MTATAATPTNPHDLKGINAIARYLHVTVVRAMELRQKCELPMALVNNEWCSSRKALDAWKQQREELRRKAEARHDW